MNRMKIFTVAMFLLMGMTLGAVNADAVETSASASVDVMSTYMWRGQQLSDGMAYQPSIGLTYGAVGFNIWSNYDDATTAINETDYTINYTFDIEKLAFDIGYIFYTFPNSDSDTQEIYVSASYDTMLSPSLTLYYDFDEGEGAFIVASVGHSLPVAEGYSLDLGASASYNAGNLAMGTVNGTDFSDFYNADISASMTIQVNDEISITPMIAYTTALSDDAETVLKGFDATGGNDDDAVYGGVNLALSF